MNAKVNRRRNDLYLQVGAVMFVVYSVWRLHPSNPQELPDPLLPSKQSKSPRLETWTVLDPALPICRGNLVPVKNVPTVPSKSRIPRIIHQTSKSRCITKNLSNSVSTWKALDDYAYCFHDDDDIRNFFNSRDWSMFFPFKHMLPCIKYGAVLSDIWRYLFLWEFGGIYADLDSATNQFNSTTISPDDDAFFIIERDGLLSQYFMAVSPRHPLMYYAIQRTILALLREFDTGNVNAGYVSGPRALHEAFMHFLWDQGTRMEHEEVKPHPVDTPGLYMGTDNRTILLVGTQQTSNDLVHRESILSRREKKKQYSDMNMTHFSQRKPTKQACLSLVYRATMKEKQVKERRKHGKIF